jgi:hypothetical protein
MAFNGTGANVTTLNAANISSGTLAADRGGTGITSTGTAGNVLTSNGTAWVSEAIAAGGDYIMTAFTSSGTWTKPAGLKAVKVTVVGAGGNGGNGTPNDSANRGGNGGGGGAAIEYLDAPAIPGPVTVTVGTAPSKTSSFGPFLSATGGTNGANAGAPAPAPIGPYGGGSGSGGTVNFTGQAGFGAGGSNPDGYGGGAALGFGPAITHGSNPGTGRAGILYGGGATGGTPTPNLAPAAGGAGGAGIVIVEEFY